MLRRALPHGRATATLRDFMDLKYKTGFGNEFATEAVEGARRMMQVHLDHWPGWEGSCEVRRISGQEEGPPTP